MRRICPQPDPWSGIYKCLPGAPPKPLILAAWWHTSDAEKEARFKEHIAWAHEHGVGDLIDAYINALGEEQWHYGE